MSQEHAIELGDVVEVLRSYADDSFDGVLCDPPYGLSFMGRKWDYDVPGSDLWREVLRVCKPGAPLIAFSGTRTYHRTVVQIEDAGWEIRDQLAWMYGSGFPKSLDVSKAIDAAAGAVREVIGSKRGQGNIPNDRGKWGLEPNKPVDVTAPATDAARLWHGYGTALKPAFEPAVLARKPLEGTVAQNVAKWGVGALAIDASRIGTGDDKTPAPTSRGDSTPWFTTGNPQSFIAYDVLRGGDPYSVERTHLTEEAALDHAASLGCGASVVSREVQRPAELGGDDSKGRWPANVLLDEEAGAALDAQTGALKAGVAVNRNRSGVAPNQVYGKRNAPTVDAGYGGDGGASRFFYCAKAARKERDAGLEGMPTRTRAECTDREEGSAGSTNPRAGAGSKEGSKNHHPTVKPIALMTYLARLIMPPSPGAILVPFSGSGSEMIGCLKAGWPAVLGVERESEYVEIARRRLAHHTRAA